MTDAIAILDALAGYRRRLVSSAAAAVLLAGWVAPAYAEATIDTALEGLAPMTTADLGDQRGGFSFGNMNISFGLSISTTVAGGTLGPGVTVTTNFTINMPGDLKNLGTTITNNVNDKLKEKGLIDDGNPATPTLAETIENKVAEYIPPAGPKDPPAPPSPDSYATTVVSAPTLPESSVSAAGATPPPPTVEVTMVSSPDVPPPASPPAPVEAAPSAPPEGTTVASIAPPAPVTDAPVEPAKTEVAPKTVETPAGIKSDGSPSSSSNTKLPEVSASVDPATGNVKLAFGSGGSTFLEYIEGQVAKIQNTENGLAIKSELKADYVIDGYNQLATASNLNAQVRSIADQFIALGGH